MKKITAIIFLYVFPILVFGQQVTNANTLFSKVNSLLKLILPVIISIAVIWFIYNVFNYAILSGDEDAKEKAKSNMIWGIVALFVMVSVWGLVGILKGTFGLTNTVPLTPILPY